MFRHLGRATIDGDGRLKRVSRGEELDVALAELFAQRGALVQILDRQPEPGP